MLFSSYDFFYIFLPLILISMALICRLNLEKITVIVLLAASFLFYGWSDFSLLYILGISIGTNAVLAYFLHKTRSKAALLFTIAFNLGLLGYFKYTNFFIENIGQYFIADLLPIHLALPLGISFFTFQQIGYQVDVYKGITKPAPFLKYALFVTFFPQLIAGPIVHYKSFLPQIKNIAVTYSSLGIGISLFIIGLSKKVLIADKLAPLVNFYFSGIGNPDFQAGIVDTWFAVIAYSFQLYFDFSGYADMALGIGLCFSIVLPINFFSPYRASSLTEFWRRWHITLSDFLREYVYIPLGGNRVVQSRQFVNILLTMLVGGFWHGAGWTFILWGGLSGIIMGAERMFAGTVTGYQSYAMKACRITLTFFMITLLWVLFRADSLETALHIYKILLGGSDIIIGNSFYEPLLYGSLEKKFLDISSVFISLESIRTVLLWLGLLGMCGIIVFVMPNTAQLFKEHLKIEEQNPVLSKIEGRFKKLVWRPNLFWFVITSILMIAATVFMKRQVEFLYFQF